MEPKLELKHDINENIKSNRIRKVAWIFMGLVLLASLLGLTGEGWLSKTDFKGNHFMVEYDQYIRYEQDTKIMISSISGYSDTALTVEIPEEMYMKLNVERVSPEPEKTELKKGKWIYHFKSAGLEKEAVVFFIKPRRTGRCEAQDMMVNHDRIHYCSFIYP